LAWPGAVRAEAAVLVAADVQAIRAELRRPGAKAVLVNVWATWCEPCRTEMPALLQFFRAHSAEGLRLMLISADDDSERDEARRFLGAQGVDFPTWIKQGDDMGFIDALDPRWTGTLPASFLFDGRGRLRDRWYGEVTRAQLDQAYKRLQRRTP
jgi:thiol-disulfide isomerase/thioredoxin